MGAAALWFFSLFRAFTATLRYLSLFALRLKTLFSSLRACSHQSGFRCWPLYREQTSQAHLLKGFVNVLRGLEELLGEHVDVALANVVRDFLFGRFALLLQFTLVGLKILK